MKRSGLVTVALASAITMMSAGGVLAVTPTPAPPTTAPAKAPEPSASTEVNKEMAAPDEAASARNAARTRMRECGHQWSAMKKSGAAIGLTWKEFSQGCLARK